LEAGSGIRHILLRIREKGSVSNILSVNTYLNPTVSLKSDGVEKSLALPHLLSAELLSTSGCVNDVTDVEFERALSCEPAPDAEKILVDIEFSDGEVLSLGAAI
jgi:hypothetical protein